jgi:hypothetical protein
MNINHPTPNWQTLGEFELPIDASTDAAVHAWLAEILVHLNLSSDFLERVLKSAQESVGHTFQSDAENVLSHIHISILVPCGHIPSGRSWGFFRIERIEASEDSSDERHHAIDFYLYVEGE